MVSLAESAGIQQPIRAALDDGIAQLSANESITFTKYVRKVLPLDGYVFWLAGETMTLQGSLHYATSRQQNEDETSSVNSVIFTTTTPIQDLNRVDPQTIWIATVDGIRFAFARRAPFYTQSGLHHYEGEAVYNAMSSQLVSSMQDLLAMEPIVSNSLPAWLALQSYAPIWLRPSNPGITLYPSFLVPANLSPPYGAVHIEPSATQAIQAAPRLTNNATHYQLATDRVRITLYGLSNAQAQDFVDTVNDYSLNQDVIGIMNMPILRDDKRTQPEIQAIAMKKVIEYDVSYYQTRINDIARQLIEAAVTTYNVAPYPVAQ